MFDYTQEGLRARQGDLAVGYLNLIDTKLEKINRKLTLITLVVVGTTLYKNKEVLKDLKNHLKGE